MNQNAFRVFVPLVLSLEFRETKGILDSCRATSTKQLVVVANARDEIYNENLSRLAWHKKKVEPRNIYSRNVSLIFIPSYILLAHKQLVGERERILVVTFQEKEMTIKIMHDTE